MADIFVSYTSSDRKWAEWIANELKTLDHLPHIHEWEIEGSDDIYGWVEKHFDAADHVLCVTSDDYLKAPYSTLERHAALWQAAKKRPGFVLLAVVKPCSLPTLSDHLRRCELYGVPEDAARLRFREFMEKRGAPTDTAFPGKVFAVCNIPIRVPTHFMGRDDALETIEAALKGEEGRVAITALHGLRGVGKTTLAAAYAERHCSDYRATWWIRAQTDAGLRADLVALGIRLDWLAAGDNEEPGVGAVMERLRHEGEGVLLIFDNAVDANALKPYLPRGGAARVLVTSNAHAWRGVAAPIEIAVWSKDIGADYLIARTGREAERAAAEDLSQALGGLPLAHEQAAAYCERLAISLADYCKRFQAAPVRFLDDARHAPAEYRDGLTVAKTFALAIDEAAKLHAAAESLVVHAALLAPEAIPLFLFAEARDKFGEPLASMLAGEGLDEVVAALRAFALVSREAIVDDRDSSITTDAIRLHRVVREVAAAKREGGAREPLRRALVAALAAVYPADGGQNPAVWLRCARLTPHLVSVCETEMDDGPAQAECAELLNRVGNYFHGRAAYSGARPLFERALAIREKTLGPEHPDTARSLHNLARLLRDEGDLAAARPLRERALAIAEKTRGPEHPDTARALNNLALQLEDEGNFGPAMPLLERALAIAEKTLGLEHPSTATILNNVADLLRAQGDFGAAKPLFERALAVKEKALGPEHPGTGETLNNLALMLEEQGDLAAARPLFERALMITEKTLGPEHPETATGLHDLAGVLRDQGDFGAARSLLERALAITEKTLGPEHPDTATSLNGLAGVLRDQGDLAAARSLLERAWAIREKTRSPEHLDTATILNNLALLLRDQGDLAAARPLFERALAIYEKTRGPEYPDAATTLNNVALLLRDQGALAAARSLLERALAIYEKTLGREHPHTATILNNLALVFRDQGDLAAARSLLERALAVHEKTRGPEHPDAATILHNFAELRRDHGNLVAARSLLGRTLAIYEKRRP
jgi:tetratricopeptide (TPR) repeat protein